MISFFRKIRQSLIRENKTSHYIKYAVGEIILVVIGILIAIQINSYVSKSQLRKDNKVFLKKMIAELELNKKRMNYLAFQDSIKEFTNLNTAIKNCDSMLRYSYTGFRDTDLDLILNISLTDGLSYLNLHTSVYEELLNTGKLYSLASDSLTTAIKNYYKRLEREVLYNSDNRDRAKEGLRLFEDNIDELNRDYNYNRASFSLKDYSWFYDKKSEKYRRMQLGYSKLLLAQSNNLMKMKQIIKYSNTLILKIENELND